MGSLDTTQQPTPGKLIHIATSATNAGHTRIKACRFATRSKLDGVLQYFYFAVKRSLLVEGYRVFIVILFGVDKNVVKIIILRMVHQMAYQAFPHPLTLKALLHPQVMNINTGPRHFITRKNVGRQPADHFVSDLGNHYQQVLVPQQTQEILLIGVVMIAP